MRRKLSIHMVFFILTSLLLFSIQGNSQSWFSGNPSWKYLVDYDDCSLVDNGYQILRYKKDTLIDGKQMTVINNFGYINSYGYIDSGDYDVIYYENDGVVFRYTGSTLRKIYDFTYAVGVIDTVEFEFEEGVCDSLALFRLDSIGSIILQNDTLDVQYWNNLIDDSWIFGGYTIIEKIGIIGSHPFDYGWYCAIDYCYPIEFSCYYNEELEWSYPEGVDCSFLVADNEVQKSDLELRVFPNPSSNKFYIESNEPIEEVVVFDCFGAIVAIQAEPFEINLENVSRGVYFVQIRFRNGIQTSEMIIKN